MKNTRSVKRPGLWWKVVAVVAIIVSLFQWAVYDIGLGQATSILNDYNTLDLLEYLIEAVLWGITFIGILLSIIVFGIGSIIKAVTRNTASA